MLTLKILEKTLNPVIKSLWEPCRCAMSWYDLYLTFDLVVVTLTYNLLSGLYVAIVRCRKLIFGMDIGCDAKNTDYVDFYYF